MAKKRKDLQPTSTLEDEPRIMAEKREMMRLTKAAKSWEFTCSFCFKKFASAQAMGGHQNAHRSERLEEKRLSVRDPICYRKRAFLRAVKAGGGSREVVKRAGFNGDSREKCKDSSVVNINGGDSNSALMNFLPHKVVDESVGDGIDLDLTLKL